MVSKLTLLDYDFIATADKANLNIKCQRDSITLIETDEDIKEGILPYRPRFSAEYRVDDFRIIELENAWLMSELTDWLTSVYTMVISNYMEVTNEKENSQS